MLEIAGDGETGQAVAWAEREVSRVPAPRSHSDKLLISFLERLLQIGPTHRPSQGSAGTLRRRYGIGSGPGATVHFTESDMPRLQKLLDAVCRGDTATLNAMAAEHEASARVIYRYDGVTCEDSERFKAGASTPTIAILPLNVDAQVFAEVSYMAAKAEAVARFKPQVLVVCDSLVNLRNVRALPWVSTELSERRAVALYLGDGGTTFTRSAAAAVVRANRVPVLAAVAYSPRGLLAVRTMPRLESICVPRQEWLAQFASPVTSQRFAKQLVTAGPTLDAVESEPLRSRWMAMKKFGHAFGLGDLAI